MAISCQSLAVEGSSFLFFLSCFLSFGSGFSGEASGEVSGLSGPGGA